MTHHEQDPDELTPLTFEEEETADLRRQFLRYAIRIALIFAFLVAAVYFAFWWSGAAVKFGADRAADRLTPTWNVSGMVRDVRTRAPIPWARVEDDPSGQRPYFQAEADHLGRFELRTLAAPHRLRITAPGYQPAIVSIGRVWFLWLPSGQERCDIDLHPER